MGGDHKCPVCQATFTRPQHVARHMRSHTGDRPYKCQYCGDQFARSDLLARHINKCHANEKPLPNTTAAGRRKGSAASSRATTSKQACDQCVQSSLPCDGSNPCSKCISRKCRCTYVKFHRQTAPSGPGHHPPRPPPSSSSFCGSIGSSRLPSNHLDALMPPPPSFVPPASSGPFPGADQNFNSIYPPNWTDMSLPGADLTAKYCTQAELVRRPSIPSNSPPTILPNMYANQQNQPPFSHWSWGESGFYPPLDDTKSFDGIAKTHSLTSSEPPSFAPDFHLSSSPYRPRRISLDLSDSSSATSHSVPSSATSSSVHLPLPGNEVYNSSEEMQRHTHDARLLQHQRRSSMPTVISQPPFAAPSDPQTQQPQRAGEGGFSSAFGLMSIDDPSVLAGLSSDGVPFFSNLGMGILPHSPNATPMPTRVQHPHLHGRERPVSLGALPTPRVTKDAADTRELKDMWKTYLRSPLGSGTATFDVSSPAQMPQSPSGQRRRVRVSSLPSVTPMIEETHPLMVNEHGDAAGGESMRVHGNPDDLRSYEAAVNARSVANGSLKLNLVPRRKGARTNPSEEEMGGAFWGTSAGQDEFYQGVSRPSSSGSSSSLAHAFTMPVHHHHASTSGVVKPPPLQGASISLPIQPSMPMSTFPGTFGSSTSLTFEPVSRASSVTSEGTGTGGSGSDGEPFRPSFKRYASQTLGPASSKRVLVERESRSVKLDKGVQGAGVEGMEGLERVGLGAGSPGSRPIAALPERATRKRG